MLKVITIINWIVIGVLAILVLAETLHPTKGGDAAGRGMGQAIYYLAIIALVVLLALNLLPFTWSKYAALALILLPFFVTKLDGLYTGIKKWADRIPEGYDRDGKPWFQDPQRQQVALAIYNGDVDKVKKLLQEASPSILGADPGGDNLLQFTVNEATYTSYKPDEKTECVRLFFEAGARLPKPDSSNNPLIVAVATAGRAQLVQLLLDQGASPNTRDVYSRKPILYEAITTHREVLETVQILLDRGADPNASWTEAGSAPSSPLIHAAMFGRWSVCLQLLEKGADPHFVGPEGKTLQSLVQDADPWFQGDWVSTRTDFDRLKKMIR